MAVLKKNQSILAFWGARSSFITGLDPLGLQISSEAAYTTLLPGITNLTNRIRYYGFYCWLFDHYAHHIRHTDPEEQNAFIRKSELMLAIVMKSHTEDYTQVTGSNYAVKLIAEGNGGAYDLETHAVKKGGNTTYWKYESGAFGQYYAGAMGEMGLTTKNLEGNFICTTANHLDAINGTELAEAFASCVSEKARSQFLDCVNRGQLPKDTIPLLFEQFALNGIIADSPEWRLYVDLLLGRDHPMLQVQEDEQITYHRKNTVRYLLRYSETNDSETVNLTDFPVVIGKSKGVRDRESSVTLSIWYFYHLNERWQYAAGSVFMAVLADLEKEGNPRVVRFTESCAEKVTEVLSSVFGMQAQHLVRQETEAFSLTLDECEALIAAGTGRELFEEAVGLMAMGLLALFNLYREHYRHASETLREMAQRMGLMRDGNFLEVLDELHGSELTLSEYVRFFIHCRIVQRHQYVAMRKMGNGTQNTLKFIMEEGRIRHLVTVEPRYTSPRLGALTNILSDLSIIDDTGRLTAVGKTVLQNLQSNVD